jgi:hypothetical protein
MTMRLLKEKNTIEADMDLTIYLSKDEDHFSVFGSLFSHLQKPLGMFSSSKEQFDLIRV